MSDFIKGDDMSIYYGLGEMEIVAKDPKLSRIKSMLDGVDYEIRDNGSIGIDGRRMEEFLKKHKSDLMELLLS